jgi:hypothetical protein
MKKIPKTKDSPVIRTDFTDDAAWQSICEAIEQLDSEIFEFKAYVEFINEPACDGMSPEQLRALIPRGWDHSFMFVVDRVTLSHPDQPILVVDLHDQPGRTFRVIPSEMWAVENNLSIANMDFKSFADHTDPDGIYRGPFPEG